MSLSRGETDLSDSEESERGLSTINLKTPPFQEQDTAHHSSERDSTPINCKSPQIIEQTQ